MQNLYTGTATAVGGRNGKVVSSDQVISLDLTMPKALGGSGAHGTNPEQLFAAGYSACFDGAVGLALRQKGIKAEGTKVTAHVTIGKTEDGGYALAAELDVTIVGVTPEVAREIAEAAHQICPYSKATRGNIDVKIKLVE
ncbi:organic hydroperoxide resistance protein [Paenibacillus filicis]|uniref:Organic hydroperoxide resistance protein n=1 Tax=Paenibacillus gyeongsangnamensis TaxID=3388067 RepID=A0ABT4QI76_9BACL|nr:organic hydroperoxide resistance protein [Paenibacillus filicis]MCZ8516569.1 organic hydroperoxide resistance protein [Paenibacillus filicis]